MSPVIKSNHSIPLLTLRMPLGAGVADTCQGLEWGGSRGQDGWVSLAWERRPHCGREQSQNAAQSSGAGRDLMGDLRNHVKCQSAFRAPLYGPWGCDSRLGQPSSKRDQGRMGARSAEDQLPAPSTQMPNPALDCLQYPLKTSGTFSLTPPYKYNHPGTENFFYFSLMHSARRVINTSQEMKNQRRKIIFFTVFFKHLGKKSQMSKKSPFTSFKIWAINIFHGGSRSLSSFCVLGIVKPCFVICCMFKYSVCISLGLHI